MSLPLAGFVGFVPFAELLKSDVPAGPGAYMITRPALTPPVFLPESLAGRFKGKDRSAPLAELQSVWVAGEPVYVFNADEAALSHEDKAAGKVSMEGKDYVMADGDIVEFRFNV